MYPKYVLLTHSSRYNRLETTVFKFESGCHGSNQVGIQVYDVIGYQIDAVYPIAIAIDSHDIMGYAIDQVDPIIDQMDPVNSVTIGIVFCSRISYKVVSVEYFIGVYECALHLYFEFEFESINVKCELNFCHNGYDYPPVPPPPPPSIAPIRASTVDCNIDIRIPGNNILECMIDSVCNVNNENFCNNGFNCSVLSPPTSSPQHPAIFIFDGSGIDIVEREAKQVIEKEGCKRGTIVPATARNIVFEFFKKEGEEALNNGFEYGTTVATYDIDNGIFERELEAPPGAVYTANNNFITKLRKTPIVYLLQQI